MATTENQQFILRFLNWNLMIAALLVYVVMCVPLYFWLVGQVGTVNDIEPSLVILTLILGSVMFVPIIGAWLRRIKRKYQDRSNVAVNR